MPCICLHVATRSLTEIERHEEEGLVLISMKAPFHRVEPGGLSSSREGSGCSFRVHAAGDHVIESHAIMDVGTYIHAFTRIHIHAYVYGDGRLYGKLRAMMYERSAGMHDCNNIKIVTCFLGASYNGIT